MEPHDPTDDYLDSLFIDIEKRQTKILKGFELKNINYNEEIVWLNIDEFVLPIPMNQIKNPKDTMFVYQNKYEIEKIPIVSIQGVKIPLSCKQMIQLDKKYSKPFKNYLK